MTRQAATETVTRILIDTDWEEKSLSEVAYEIVRKLGIK